jgi:S1-C subfamily serine protease
MRAQLLHLSGPSRGRTITYAVPLVTIGADPSCTVFLPVPGVALRHARLEWVQEQCAFHLFAEGGQVFVNGDEVQEVILRDEDQLEFGVDGPRARFRVYVPHGAVCKPVRHMLADAKVVASHSGRAAGTRSFTRDLVLLSTWQLRLSFAALLVAGAFLAGWFGGWLGARPSLEEQRRTADMVTHADLEDLRHQVGTQSDRLRDVAAANDTVRRIQGEWIRGVGLVHGAYRLRLPDDSFLELDGGEVFEPEYTGTGFLASAQGFVVTNRHVVAPWESVAVLQPMLERGIRPEFVRLTVTFPGKAPIAVPFDGIILRPDKIDVAVLRLDPAAVSGIPVLPLEPPLLPHDPAPVYQRAFVVGYPTGLEGILYRASDTLVDELRQRKASMTDAIAALAAAGQIKPAVNQGGVSNVEERVVVYDAPTTYGGSGGPVFGDQGVVIAVNFAIQKDFHGANYGVPIRYARELLPR